MTADNPTRQPGEADAARVGLAILDAHGQWETENNRRGGQNLWGDEHCLLLGRAAMLAAHRQTVTSFCFDGGSDVTDVCDAAPASELADARDENARWLSRFSAIREASGVGAGPMLAELPEAIAAVRRERDEAVGLLRPFAAYYELNDLDERDADDALEVPVRDLRMVRDFLASLRSMEGADG